MKFGVSL